MESTKDQMYVTVYGSNRVELVGKLRAAADNLDGMPADITGKPTRSQTKPAASSKAKAAPVAEVEEDYDFKADTGDASGFDNDAPAEEEQSFDDAADEPPPKKTTAKKGAAKAKKLTLDDVNDACKAHAAAKGRPATLDVLQKKFKTQSVTALKPEQYEACISAMAVN